MIKELYIASGLIGSNPSAIGVTYANRLVGDNGSCHDRSGVLPSWKIEFTAVVTNNQAEMWAMLEGLRRLPEIFSGTIYSRNQVTLGRIFSGWKWTNIPSWIHQIYRMQRKRLLNWGEIKYTLVDAENEHYKWCKQACREAGEKFLAEIGRNIPSTPELVSLL